MNNQQEAAVQRLSDEILLALGKLTDYDTTADRRKYFKEAAKDAVQKLTKDDVINILEFVIVDYELFFDIFEESIQRSKRASESKSQS